MRKVLPIMAVVFFYTFSSIALAQNMGATPEKNDVEAMIVGSLKSAAEFIGASKACNNKKDEADAIRLHESILKSGIKNGVIAVEDEEFMKDLARTTALKTKTDFHSNPNVKCEDVHAALMKIKNSIDMETTNPTASKGKNSSPLLYHTEKFYNEFGPIFAGVILENQRDIRLYAILLSCEQQGYLSPKSYMNYVQEKINKESLVKLDSYIKNRTDITDENIKKIFYSNIMYVKGGFLMGISFGFESAIKSSGFNYQSICAEAYSQASQN